MNENRTLWIIIAALAGVGGWLWWRNRQSNEGAASPFQPGTYALTFAQPGAPFAPAPATPYPTVSPLVQPDAAQAIANQMTTNAGMPTGIRNNNPFNLRWSAANNWQGQVGPDERGYAKFSSVYYGIRAGMLNLRNGYFNKGLNTLAKIFPRYAPSNDNNPTQAYINFLAQYMGITPTTAIIPTAPNLLMLAKGIIRFENGLIPATSDYSDAAILSAIDAALAA